MKKLFVLLGILLGLSTSYADSSPCPTDSTYDGTLQGCFYCPRGTQLINNQCQGQLILGDRCAFHNANYDASTNRCTFCPGSGYMSQKDQKCYSL